MRIWKLIIILTWHLAYHISNVPLINEINENYQQYLLTFIWLQINFSRIGNSIRWILQCWIDIVVNIQKVFILKDELCRLHSNRASLHMWKHLWTFLPQRINFFRPIIVTILVCHDTGIGSNDYHARRKY